MVTHVKEIPNTKLLVFLHYTNAYSVKMEILDVSKKAQIKKIYSHEAVPFGNI